MKYYGNIIDNNDLVNKKYVNDGGSGSPGDGVLYIQTNSTNSTSLFTANQDTNSTLNFIGRNGITISKTDDSRSTDITISGSGGVSTSTYIAVETIANIPIDKKNVIATINKGESLSFNGLTASNAGLEMNLYVLASVPVDGEGVPVTGSGSGNVTINNKINNFPVIYCGTYNSSVSPININLVTNVTGTDGRLVRSYITSANFHIFFNGDILFIDRYYFIGSVT